MNQQQVTEAIILSRTDYGEADRILTLLTPDHGKLTLMAKGVRRVKSKLAGGVELFSVTNITFIRGRGEIGTLVSARLVTHYGHIVTDIDRTMTGYNLIKRLHKATEDEPEAGYYHLLVEAFAALDDATINLDLIALWFGAQLLRLDGHTPNLQTEPDGTRLQAEERYEFSFDDSAFVQRPDGDYGADDIKFLRVVFGGNPPMVLTKISGVEQLVEHTRQLVMFMQQQYIH
ncbi:MAG TPA: DNA repair protein RecO [Candidatus Saccharimonadales bacterium]|nr:DNA repair protein RecO [Candidatus Saccharimonadales bacterium]